MRIKTALASFSIVALTLSGCGSTETGTPKAPATETPDNTAGGNDSSNTDNNNTNNNNNSGNNSGGNVPAEFSPPQPAEMPEDGCYKNYTMEWPAEQSKAFAQSVFDANGNEVQFRTWSPNGQMYGESISTYNADGKQLTSQYSVQGTLDNRRVNTYDEAGFMNSQYRDDTGDGIFNYKWNSVNHTSDDALLGKRESVIVDSDGDELADAKGTYTYDRTSGRLTQLDWDARNNGKINTVYTVVNTDTDRGYTQVWQGQTQFHPNTVENTYEEVNGEQMLSTSISTYADGTIGTSTTNTYTDNSLAHIDVDLGGDGTVDYKWVTTGTNSMGKVTSRERHVNDIPYEKTQFGYTVGTDLVNNVVNYKLNKFTESSGTATWTKTESTNFIYNEDEKVIRETQETFDDDNNVTGRSETLYTYDADGNLTTMTYDDLDHGSSLIEAVYTYSNWTTDANGNKTCDVEVTRLTSCSSELAFSEGTETYDSEDNLLSASYVAHSNPTANCDGWYNYEEQTEFDENDNPLTIKTDYYGDDATTWQEIETYTWLDADNYSTYEEDTDGDGSADVRQEVTYDANGRFDSYKVDGNDDGPTDGTWDFLLTPTTECLE